MSSHGGLPGRLPIIVGGRFTSLNGIEAKGLGAVDAHTGRTLPFAANQRIKTPAGALGITSLRSDGRRIYGTG